jgi:Kelch motif
MTDMETSTDKLADNDLLTLDLTKSWQISSPSLTGMPRPSGPPAVSLGYLWNSYDALYLYGGEFSDSPIASPVPFSTWSYDIASKSWSESSSPVTVQGDSSGPGNEPVQRAAEGAGVTIPNLGRGFYFGGHLDGYTTEGWSQSVARVYLTSMLEYTFPGYSNPSVNDGNTAGSDGLYRNITEGGTQETSGFPERADGILVYVPGYGKSGIILGLAGGTNATFTQMNIIDVYDIALSTWYKQATSGPTPEIRVNPCAVALSAADGSSTQVYMYGGQNLVPYGEQIQYDDMWILTIPSFTWIKVDTSDQATPPARAGHTCNVWNSQMVVVGGYVGQDLSCESPGVYVFNTSSLTWQNNYNIFAGEDEDKFNRQRAQRRDAAALQGSYGYMVPEKVQSVIGGNGVGSATVTAPAQTALGGPMATGSPITYTVTGADGSVVTETAAPTTQNGGGQTSGGVNKGAIIAGVLAGVLGVLAIYLGFCAWIYRKQLNLYKNHVALSQQQQLAGNDAFIPLPIGGKKISEKSQTSSDSQRFSGENRSRDSASRSNNTGYNSNNPYKSVPGTDGSATANSSTEDLLRGQEPSFLGVFLNPRRSLRVVNRD